MTTRSAKPDFLLALAVLALVATGLMLILSASSILAFNRYADSLFFVKRQFVFAVAGIGAMAWLQGLDTKKLRQALPWMMGLSILLLMAVLVPGLGRRVYGARRWLNLGPFGFQPSELFKLVLVLFSAERVATCLENGLPWQKALPPVALAAGAGALLLMMEPDFGSTMLALCMVLGIFYCAGMEPRWLLTAGMGLVPFAALMILRSPYRLRRVMVFLDPWKDANGAGFQMTHSMMAFGTGGILGTGLGEGKQKLYYLPEPHTDFIFATAGEELGLLGCLMILGFFGFLLWRCWALVLKARDPFLKLGSLALTLFLGLQILANLFVVLGLAPTKGTTLPFLSSGGTALAIDLMAVGLLMNFSKRVDADA
jgi:cell division protein FtsW